MVAFSEPESQLKRQARMMYHAGFAELRFPELANGPDGRVWARYLIVSGMQANGPQRRAVARLRSGFETRSPRRLSAEVQTTQQGASKRNSPQRKVAAEKRADSGS